MFLTGEPGAGKTHTVNQYIRYLRSHNIQPAITASTGIAATHIGGSTIHAWAGIGIAESLSTDDIHRIANRETVIKRIKHTPILIIDEVSMLPPYVLAHVNAVCQTVKESPQPFGGMQVVFVGDFFQLPPITQEEKTIFAFESSTWEQASPVVCYLSEQHRQEDKPFLNFLTQLRNGTINPAHNIIIERLLNTPPPPEDIPHLYTHNANVDRFNNKKLAELDGQTHLYTMHTKGAKKRIETLVKGCLSPEKLYLKIGAVVMFTKNATNNEYVNGTTGTVVDWDIKTKLPIVQTRQGKNITVYPAEWTMEDKGKIRAILKQLPLRLAWAITVHKSQGMSMDSAVMDLSKVFEFGQGYVALSRIRSLDGLHVIGVNKQTFEIHPDVLEQNKLFLKQSKKNEQLNIAKSDHHTFIFTCGGNIKTLTKKKKSKKKTG